MIKKMVLAVFVLIVCCGAAHGAIITNGSFDSGIDGWEFYAFRGGSFSIVTDSGNKYAELIGTQDSGGPNDWVSISQEVKSDLTIGEDYVAIFDVKANVPLEGSGPKFGRGSYMMSASRAVNSTIQTDSLIALDGKWHTYMIPFTAESSMLDNYPLFGFILSGPGKGSVCLDNISIVEASTVPVPSAIILLFSGILGLAGVGRKNRGN
ncbi:MAG: carbohydrate binding domain-containing protein [Deltaproteobacteria bacterium]|uniref:carbohydrate binding domain-containing protein n=1 Tax=Desulfobacula sp. TaxID=2593537 RepID=UPI0019B040C7|nr:carbohydrate binding domain-containing protein [Candidatus Desulfobacula maris]MBL6992384.1 carbohydrate binding domain-containing protein [Desulfobacula sp.]